jgi:hypothetical protein
LTWNMFPVTWNTFPVTWNMFRIRGKWGKFPG